MRRARTAAFLGLLLISPLPLFLARIEKPHRTLAGSVRTPLGPAAGALVRHQGAPFATRCDAAGRFRLPALRKAGRLTATLPGYRIGWTTTIWNPAIHLDPLPSRDNPDYEWIDPGPDPTRPEQCANCHPRIYAEWRIGAHARSAVGPRFLGLFAGIDAKSREHPTWNLLRENPDGAGVCASCHAPTLTSPTLEYDIRKAVGTAARGVHCDYCHKVAEVSPDPSGLRFGKDGLLLLRPAQGDPLFFGPLDDAVRPGESFAHAPFFKESTFCASCHEGLVFGHHAYGTYTEWLESPAARHGIQCQHCHMAPTGDMTNIAPSKGGIERDPRTLASHSLQGGTPEMLRQAVRLDLETQQVDDDLRIRITLTAGNVGHRVPTGFPDRHLVLVVEGFDSTANSVAVLKGRMLPSWAGKEAGKPGMMFAKRFTDEKGRTPVPFWLPGLHMDDTRLVPDEPTSESFTFPSGVCRIRVRLHYRPFWPEVARARGWNSEGFLVVEKEWRR